MEKKFPRNFLALFMGMLIFGHNLYGSSLLERQSQELKEKNLFITDYPLCQKNSELSEPQREELKSELLATDFKAPLWKYFCLYNIAGASQEEATKFQKKIDREITNDITRTWLVALEFYYRKKFDLFENYLQQAHKMMLAKGQLTSPELSHIFLKLAHSQIQAGEFAGAENHLKKAELFDNQNILLPLMRLKIVVKQAPPWAWNYARFIEQVNALKQQVKSYDNFNMVLFNLSLVLRTSIGVLFTLCLFVFALKYFPKAIHSVAEKVPGSLSISGKIFLISILGLCSLMLGVGLLTSGFLFLAYLWRFLSPREKKMGSVLFIAFFLLPFMLVMESRFYQHKIPGSIENLYRKAYRELPLSDVSESLLQVKPKKGDEEIYKIISQSIIQKKRGDFTKAKSLGLLALEQAPRNPFVLNNMGNLFFLQDDLLSARTYYQKALEILPQSPEIHFNLSQVELFSNNSYEHAVHLEKALEYNPDLNHFIRQNDKFLPEPENQKGNPNTLWPKLRRCMDLPLQLTHSLKGEYEFIKPNIQTQLAGLEINPLMYPILLGLLLMVGLLNRGNELSLIYGSSVFLCKICGKTICSLCRLGPHCKACHEKIAGIEDAPVKKELILNIQDTEGLKTARRVAVLNVIFPGSGGFYLGKPKPLVYLVPFLLVCLGWGLILSTPHFLLNYHNYSAGLFYSLAAVPLALMYALAFLRFLFKDLYLLKPDEGGL